MTNSNIAFLDEDVRFHIREDRGDYVAHADTHEAAADCDEHLYEAQARIGDAMNLAGLLLKALEDEGDARAMQICTAVEVIEEKLRKACNRLDKHDADHTKLLVAYTDLRNKVGNAD